MAQLRSLIKKGLGDGDGDVEESPQRLLEYRPQRLLEASGVDGDRRGDLH